MRNQQYSIELDEDKGAPEQQKSKNFKIWKKIVIYSITMVFD